MKSLNGFFRTLGAVLIVMLAFPGTVAASDEIVASTAAGHANFAVVFLFLAIIIIASKLGTLVEKIGQPPVLGELCAGIVLGALGLAGFSLFNEMKHNEFIGFLAELGVVILLFQIGLETNITKMRQVGLQAFLVAIVGVVVPFVLGAYVVGPSFFPGQSMNTYLFLGATLTATSVGITARVFKDKEATQRREAQIVLGAAVIDDVLGLLILAVVTAIVSLGSISLGAVGIISAKAFGFLIASIVLGQFFAPYLSKGLSLISTGMGMKMGLALSFGLLFAYLASVAGLAPIVGAFAAGLVLDPVHFRWFKAPRLIHQLTAISGSLKDDEVRAQIMHEVESHQHRHIEELIEDIAMFIVPIFFVYTGMQVDITTFLDPKVLVLALAVTVVAFIGKLVSGLAAGKGSHKLLVGVSMIPRGEVGLIFASVGAALGVVTPAIFSVIVIMIILSTLIPPIILNHLLRKSSV